MNNVYYETKSGIYHKVNRTGLGLKVAYPEEVAESMGYISKEQLLELAET